MDVIANAGLDDEEEDEEEGVWCADGLVNLKIVSVTSGNDDESCKEVSSAQWESALVVCGQIWAFQQLFYYLENHS